MCVLATFGFLELASFGGQLTMLTITGSHFNRIHSQYCKKIGMTYEEIREKIGLIFANKSRNVGKLGKKSG